MARKKYQTRLPADTADEVDEYIEKHEISQAEGIRRLVESGLKADEPDHEPDDEPDMAEASINETARQSGTILMILMLAFLTAAEVGLI